jgi:peptidoglycan/LPS O-acetylase OafA/YrhL
VGVHAQFTALAVGGLIVTSPAIIIAWRARLPSRKLATALYAGGFALIGATLVLDPILNPPLFYHGFFPGVGVGGILIALALAHQEYWGGARKRSRQSQP